MIHYWSCPLQSSCNFFYISDLR